MKVIHRKKINLVPDNGKKCLDLTLTNTINSFTYFSTSFPIDAIAQSSALPKTLNKSSKSDTFGYPLFNDALSICPQPEDTFRPWATVDDDEIASTLPMDHDFGAANRITWIVIQDYLILAEKYWGRSTLAHNSRIFERLPDWILGVSKIQAHMVPASKREGSFNLVRRQAGDRLLFIEEALTAEASLCDKVAAVHTETMTRLLESECDKTLFPELHNRATKMARSRAAAYGKKVYDSVGNRPATNEKLDDVLIEPLPQNEFKVIARKQQAACSRSPLPGPSQPRSRSPRSSPPTTTQPSGARPINRQAPQRPNQPRQSTSYANAAQCRPANDYQCHSQPQQQPAYRRPHNQAAPSATQLSADELARLRALLQKHKQTIMADTIHNNAVPITTPFP